MNVERCIELHNEILRHGWVHSGHDISQFETVARSWMSHFGDDELGILSDLVPEIREFLQQARIILDEPDKSGGFSLFFWVDNLAAPGNIFAFEEQLEMALDPVDDTVPMKFAKPEKHPKSHFDLGFGNYPWHYMRSYKHMLDETLEAFNKLVEAIEARLPQGSSLNDDNDDDDDDDYIKHGLVDADVLQLHNIPAGFAREFLEKAQTPRFQNVAPGLKVITTSTISKQYFISDTSGTLSKQSVPPILLFYSKLDYDQSQDQIEPGGTGPFGYPYRNYTSFPAGLCLLQTMSDDSCKFILPFNIGGKGYARRTDGAFYGENEPKNSFDDLYSLGFHPFETTYAQNLASILKNWLGMVERGDWKIDEHGVAGGMEIWKEADTEEHWEKYVIKRNFG
ncbi:hypothetical protein N0V95_005651 [Ascochyta clinopodiicola]|nr:hypothetical protein N0V95_005651 [Ascochyta clinopodiicola]